MACHRWRSDVGRRQSGLDFACMPRSHMIEERGLAVAQALCTGIIKERSLAAARAPRTNRYGAPMLGAAITGPASSHVLAALTACAAGITGATQAEQCPQHCRCRLCGACRRAAWGGRTTCLWLCERALLTSSFTSSRGNGGARARGIALPARCAYWPVVIAVAH